MLRTVIDQPPIPFHPTPDAASAVIDALTDPHTTLADVASQHNTTFEALVEWLARPEIAQRIENIESACYRKTRLVAANYLPFLVETAIEIIRSYRAEEEHIPVDPKDRIALEQRRRSRETARRAASLLVRLSRIQAPPCGRGWGGARQTPALSHAFPPAGGNVAPKERQRGLPRAAERHATSDPFLASPSPNGHSRANSPDLADLILDHFRENPPPPSATGHSPLATGSSLTASASSPILPQGGGAESSLRGEAEGASAVLPTLPRLDTTFTNRFAQFLASLPDAPPDGTLNGSMDLSDPTSKPPPSTAPP